jgi:hypothetical protein
MISPRNTYRVIVAVVLLLACGAVPADAQMPVDPMGLPIPTTIVLARPARGERYGDRLLITVGVGKKIYKFILKDGYTNHPYVRWSSIWEHVRQSSPNLLAEGVDSEEFARFKPGATVTVSGMFTATQRCFEVISMNLGDRFESDLKHR